MLDALSPFYYFFVIGVLLVFVKSPLFNLADASWHSATTRTINIDGLRGILALSVFTQHSALLHGSLIGLSWPYPISNLFNQAGQASVSLFFMITGFLFWRKAIETNGRLSWGKLYITRFFRIAPVFYLSISIVLFVVFYESHFQLREAPSILFTEIAPLLLSGFYKIGHLINGYPFPGEINANVTWTLRYEWEYYLLILPISAIFARRAGWHIWYAVAGFVLLTIITIRLPSSHSAIALLEFFGGMLCASIQERFAFVMGKRLNFMLSFAVLLLLMLLMFFETAYQTAPFLILWAIFLLITSGCSIFGLLSSRAARRLGELSFGIYLLHGIVLHAFFNSQGVSHFARSSTPYFWMMIVLVGMASVLVAMAAHLLVEVPGINFGRNLSRRVVYRHEVME
ncbi:MAG: acyltransferase [Betaproteobacteria bacterium]|nr:acyltransferase [Betaproteobacteria bacterium]